MDIEKIYTKTAVTTRKNGAKSVVTIVGKFVQGTEEHIVSIPTRVKRNKKKHMSYKDATTYVTENVMFRSLTIGISICNQADKFDEDYGVQKALKRIDEGADAGTIYTNSVTMLTEDGVEAEMMCKLNYVCENIDTYQLKGKRSKYKIIGDAMA